MVQPPKSPKIYHITHRNNLESIIKAGALYSDARMIRESNGATSIGMNHIKARRLNELEVPCHPNTTVGAYVPFYFCPRSFMLFILHKSNHPDLAYDEGQAPIVHLEADLNQVVEWANSQKPPIMWAFTLQSAAARFAEFRDDLTNLNQINWAAVRSSDFRDRDTKDGKQAEFLIYDSFPLRFVQRVGVLNATQQAFVVEKFEQCDHQPLIEILPRWYY